MRELLPVGAPFDDELVLPFERRRHSRLRARLASGREVAVLLPRGTVMRDGVRLGGADSDGRPLGVRVVAEPEAVARITGSALIRAAWHLGNRHVPVQIGDGFLRMERDPVLRDMLERLGFSVEDEIAPFEPEPGAYGSHAGSH
ncbi:MAG TPA: urease accessory protein UreE [Vulgatibacter sp.]